MTPVINAEGHTGGVSTDCGWLVLECYSYEASSKSVCRIRDSPSAVSNISVIRNLIWSRGKVVKARANVSIKTPCYVLMLCSVFPTGSWRL